MISVYFAIFSCFGIYTFVDAACTFPVNFTDTWYSADKGKLVISGLQIVDYPVDIPGAGTFDFDCIDQSGTQYLLQAVQNQNIFGTITRFFLCLDIQKLSDDVYKYFVGTEYSPLLQDTIFAQATTIPTLTQVCDRATPYEPETYVMLVRNGSVEAGSAEVTCPSDILATFDNMTITEGGVSESCAGTSLDVCTNKTKLMYTFDGGCTTKKPFTSEGIQKCLHYVTSGGTTYLSVWNMDASPTVQFSCYAFLKSDSTTVMATETPKYCTNTTTHLVPGTQGGTAGKILLLSSGETCLDTTTTSSTTAAASTTILDLNGLYALLVIPFYLLVSLLTILGLVIHGKCVRFCKKKKELPVKERPESPEIYIHPESSNMKLTFTMRPDVYKKHNVMSVPLFRPKRKTLKIIPFFDPNWNPATYTKPGTLPQLFALPRVEPRVMPMYNSCPPPIMPIPEEPDVEFPQLSPTSPNPRSHSAVSLYSFDNMIGLLGR